MVKSKQFYNMQTDQGMKLVNIKNIACMRR